jgi:PKD repeat protein
MLRKNEKLSRLLMGATVLASVLACQADSPSRSAGQLVGPVTPISIQVRLTSNRSSLTADGEATATLTATVTRDGAPIADFTTVTISTTLGTLDSPAGGNAVELLTTGGRVTTILFPGSVEGIARLTASVFGAVGITNVTIKPAVEVVLPPTASTLSISSDTVVVSDEDASTNIGVTATVLGSNLKPFKKAPVYFSVNPAIGLFGSSGGTVGDIIATNSAGQASDTLTVNGDDLTAISALSITATLTVEGGGTITAAVSITIVHGPAPPVASTAILSTDKSFVVDDGSTQAIVASALVKDQYGVEFPGASVTFSSSIPNAFSPNPATSDGSGLASSTISLSGGDIAAHIGNTFTISATLTTPSGTVAAANSPVIITIVRQPQAAFIFNGASLSLTANFVDQSTGGSLTYDWDFDTSAPSTDSTLQNPTHTYGAPGSYTVRLTVTNLAGSSTVTQTVTVPFP